MSKNLYHYNKINKGATDLENMPNEILQNGSHIIIYGEFNNH